MSEQTRAWSSTSFCRAYQHSLSFGCLNSPALRLVACWIRRSSISLLRKRLHLANFWSQICCILFCTLGINQCLVSCSKISTAHFPWRLVLIPLSEVSFDTSVRGQGDMTTEAARWLCFGQWNWSFSTSKLVFWSFLEILGFFCQAYAFDVCHPFLLFCRSQPLSRTLQGWLKRRRRLWSWWIFWKTHRSLSLLRQEATFLVMAGTKSSTAAAFFSPKS